MFVLKFAKVHTVSCFLFDTQAQCQLPVIYHQANTFSFETVNCTHFCYLFGPWGGGWDSNIDRTLPSCSALSPLGLDELSSFYYEILVPLLASKSVSWLVI